MLFVKYNFGVAFIFFVVSLCSGCAIGTAKEEQVFNYLNDVEPGVVINLGDLFEMPDGYICALYPYQDALPSDVVESARINNYLFEMNYVSSESIWSFVVYNTEEINKFSFHRSERFDILSRSEIASGYQDALPKKFRPRECLDLKFAKLAKVEIDSRIFFVMGEVR